MSFPDLPHGAFLENIGRCFEDDVREQGTRMAVRSEVHLLHGDETSAEGVVIDRSLHRVKIGLLDGVFDATCGCLHRARGMFCAHAWAMLVRAASKGHLRKLSGANLPDVRASVRSKAPEPASWREAVSAVRADLRPFSLSRESDLEVFYHANPEEAIRRGALVLRVGTRRRKKKGGLGVPHLRGLSRPQVERLENPVDRRILELLLGPAIATYFSSAYERDAFVLGEALVEALLPDLCRTGRFFLWDGVDKNALPAPCAWDDGEPWALRYELAPEQGGLAWIVQATFRRGEERMAPEDPDLVLAPGFLFRRGRAARFAPGGDLRWLTFLRRRPRVRVPTAEIDPFLAEVFATRDAFPLELPPDLRIQEVEVEPQPRLRIGGGGDPLPAHLSFAYAEVAVDPKDPRDRLFRVATRQLVRRRRDREQAAADRLAGLGFRPAEPSGFRIDLSKVPAAVSALVGEGWTVEGEAGVYVAPGRFNFTVSSGVDWFDLDGGVDFGGAKATFPELLAALRSRRGYVRLGDGRVGLLPEDWLRRHGLLLAAGEASDGRLRFKPTQAMMIDLLLASEGETRTDATFDQARKRWRSFDGVAPEDPPAGFQGALRPYQRAGLGWMKFLRESGLGGILADDMGLGKTVQALAWLEVRRQAGAGPSLVVVPRSVLHNWASEAGRFAPSMRVTRHWGLGRAREPKTLKDVDLILTTYGTLRQDAAVLKNVAFDVVILDEAQMIKNAGSATAKAARLLKGNQRLALSGTPIENHLGELWSLMEFLNPGMLGSAAVFRGATEAGAGIDEEGRVLLSRALRPFILRRTKDQVAPELPARTEQTILVEFDDAERKRYDDLKAHYRASLLGGGRKASKFNVLEGLLRLRQAACHPGLMDPSRRGQSSPKLEALLEGLREVAAEGRKALVFSQFTTFLGIVREALTAEGIVCEYLDGKTRDRAARVDRFRTDADCPVFLISLKAGGLGLNLTEAEVVFLLDPWWNPAVEAQAIDRTHRIGQTRPVFAYRLVTSGTVEEKVLELQKSKRELADAILGADGSLLGNLTREDLELLLG